MDETVSPKRLLEAYASAVKEQNAAEVALSEATCRVDDARLARQNAWRKVAALRNEGTIMPGIYRVGNGAEAIAIGSGDYPELQTMLMLRG